MKKVITDHKKLLAKMGPPQTFVVPDSSIQNNKYKYFAKEFTKNMINILRGDKECLPVYMKNSPVIPAWLAWVVIIGLLYAIYHGATR